MISESDVQAMVDDTKGRVEHIARLENDGFVTSDKRRQYEDRVWRTHFMRFLEAIKESKEVGNLVHIALGQREKR